MTDQEKFNLDTARELSSISSIVKDTHARLFGIDGEGGRIEDLDSRINSLETSRAKTNGIVLTISSFVAFLGGERILSWFHK